jgi:hypothetical protein
MRKLIEWFKGLFKSEPEPLYEDALLEYKEPPAAKTAKKKRKKKKK